MKGMKGAKSMKCSPSDAKAEATRVMKNKLNVAGMKKPRKVQAGY